MEANIICALMWLSCAMVMTWIMMMMKLMIQCSCLFFPTYHTYAEVEDPVWLFVLPYLSYLCWSWWSVWLFVLSYLSYLCCTELVVLTWEHVWSARDAFEEVSLSVAALETNTIFTMRSWNEKFTWTKEPWERVAWVEILTEHSTPYKSDSNNNHPSEVEFEPPVCCGSCSLPQLATVPLLACFHLPEVILFALWLLLGLRRLIIFTTCFSSCQCETFETFLSLTDEKCFLCLINL